MWSQSPQPSFAQLTGKRKANELTCSGGLLEPANRRPAPSDGPVPLPKSASGVKGEHAASCSRQLVSPEGGVTYASVLAGSVTPFQPNGPLKPTAMDSDPSEPAVSSDTVKRRMSSDKSGPLSDKTDGTTKSAQVTNNFLPAGERPIENHIFISGVRETRSFLACLRASCPGGLSARIETEKLMVVPSIANSFRSAFSPLRFLDGESEFPHLHAPEGPLCATSVEESGPGLA